MSAVIKVEDLSKQYRLGQVGTGSLSHDVNRWWHRMRGREDPYLKIGEENDRAAKGSSDYVWALKDINFEVQQGEVLGIIGRNGAGKSTLLKILSRTTTPTTGQIKIKGRIASLLEVGTGFHPELSGRENIFLNGAILGMTKQEIKSKFDEIVDFAGVERYIDTPVKRYSSGMYVRLAFGVAAHLEPEILIVDEVLAVGDAEFQKKALGKMKDVSGKDGRTVLFVSHNMNAIKNLCSRALLLKHGKLAADGPANKIVDDYLKDESTDRKYLFEFEKGTEKPYRINSISFNKNSSVFYGRRLIIDFDFENRNTVDDLCVGIGFHSVEGERLITIDSDSDISEQAANQISPGKYNISLSIDKFQLSPGMYSIVAAMRDGKGSEAALDFVAAQGFEVLPDKDTPNHLFHGATGGYRPIPNLSINGFDK